MSTTEPERCNFVKKHTNAQCPNDAEWEARKSDETVGYYCFKHRSVASGDTLVRYAGEPKTVGRFTLVSDLIRHDNQRHTIPLGQVVEIDYDDGVAPWGIEWSNGKTVFRGSRYDMERHTYVRPPAEFKEVCLGIRGKVKAIVVAFNRDCDGTPLYTLSDKPIGIRPHHENSFTENHEYGSWVNFRTNGFSADSLKVCEGEFIPLRYRDIYHFKACMRGDDVDLYGHQEEVVGGSVE